MEYIYALLLLLGLFAYFGVAALFGVWFATRVDGHVIRDRGPGSRGIWHRARLADPEGTKADKSLYGIPLPRSKDAAVVFGLFSVAVLIVPRRVRAPLADEWLDHLLSCYEARGSLVVAATWIIAYAIPSEAIRARRRAGAAREEIADRGL